MELRERSREGGPLMGNAVGRARLALGLVLLLFVSTVGAAEPMQRPGFFVGATGGVVAPEGGREGYGRGLQIGYRSAYQSEASPHSHVSIELDIMESVRAVRPDQRRDVDADVLMVGLHVSGNNYFTERAFLRHRLGLVIRELDVEGDDRQRRARMSAGLGLGYAVTPRTELIVDAGVQFLGTGAQLYYTGLAGLRLHF